MRNAIQKKYRFCGLLFPLFLNSQTPFSPILPPVVEKDTAVFIVAPTMPRFPGCEDIIGTDQEKYKCATDKLIAFLHKYCQYPAEASALGLSGVVKGSFIVEPNGKVNHPKIEKDIGGGCGQEVIRVLNLIPQMGIRFTPQSARFRAVRIKFTIDVVFSPDR
ncbi:MAG: energy transducer TonB [Saprospiraceae bacterium]